MSRRWDEDYQDDWGARAVSRVEDGGNSAQQRQIGGVGNSGNSARGKWLIMVIMAVVRIPQITTVLQEAIRLLLQ